MFFDSPIYFVFLAIVVGLYWQLAWRNQNRMLLAASYFFYAWWDWRFLGLIAISTLFDFYCAQWIAASHDSVRRRRLLVVSLAMNLGFLGVFKYFNFFQDSFVDLLRVMGFTVSDTTLISVLLPPGISFYTFQAVAYIIDVHERRLEPENSLTSYALFIALFPHLIAGPIQRPAHLLPQVQTPRKFDQSEMFHGVMLIITGLVRKCVVADNCALIVEGVFSGKLGPPSLPLFLLGAYAFAFQIYGDFSGYSDIARGSAKLLGFEFMVNFRQPYFASSLQDFWRRWHISLSSWLRDYLYVPLGGNRGSKYQTYRNLMATMVLGGLWHGANWTFIAWGFIHGLGLSAERHWGRRAQSEQAASTSLSSDSRWRTVGARLLVFHLVCLAWIFFRAATIGDAWKLLGGVTVWTWLTEYAIAARFLAFAILPLVVIDILNERRGEDYPLERSSVQSRFVAALAMCGIVICFSASKISAFIYFQF
jgi:alginate O-acetyltransferase complex protein AlgI